MSSMGELIFFLSLQVKQQKDGIFISQSKYVKYIVDKYGLTDSKPASTPMETHKQIIADLEGEDVEVLWIQNQMLDYGVTFLHTPIFIDNSSAISIVNNPVKHSKTKHIEISVSNNLHRASETILGKCHHCYENGVQVIKTRVCDKPLSVSEELIHIFLRLNDVAGVITNELTNMRQFNEVYVPKIPKGKVFSSMKRSPLDSEGVDTPLFSTMMVVSHNEERMASRSRPSLDHPTESQSQPSITISIPKSLIQKPTSPITNTYIRKKVKKAPSLLVPSPTETLSPLMENSPLENIYRETTGVSPNPKEVLNEEMYEHMGEQAATTPASTEEDSGNINKTSPMETFNEQSFKGPRCQETKGWRVLLLGRRLPLLKDPMILQKGVTLLEKGVQAAEIVQAAETERATVTVNAAETSKAAKTVNTAELNEAAEMVQEVLTDLLSSNMEELETAEALIKAKHDTPKVTSKTKGVVIKDNVQVIKKVSADKVNSKDKGKAKMVESDQPIKKQKLVASDEALAKKIQVELEQEEKVQVEKDREMAKALATELNEAYQKSLAT
ncbi:hypothetical protein L6452_40486 [Arctium lappa]|uniref:Uncharacterized protein n=1 Tax=Arctium lappa TaxID=4217 RepID=A0ACB8XR70_ARCLA|nr:hypothetical protein L6452_40486 [Arctium lappa]